MSIGGHLALIAIMITSFVIVVDRAKMVAPDRIQILEIDLDSVRVSGDESVLYNVGDAEPKQPQEQPVSQTPHVADENPAPEQIQLENPSLVETQPETQTNEQSREQPEKSEKISDEAPAPKKKKTVVRVNREVVSLDRTLTVSVVDALRVAMTRCWNIDTTRTDIENIRAVAHLTMRRNGTVRDVWFESAARADTDAAFAYVLDTIRSAINVCQPFKMLPPNEFSKWEKIQLTFYPTQGKVM